MYDFYDAHYDVDHERSICTYYLAGAHAVDNGNHAGWQCYGIYPVCNADHYVLSLMITAMSIMLLESKMRCSADEVLKQEVSFRI